MAVTTFDLFTGIGGMTLALHGYAKPILYCDKLEEARKVIKDNIRRGMLPPAPILDDVTNLTVTRIKDRVDMVCAGFPCVGFSAAGKKQGFGNKHTFIYHELVRVLGEYKPSLVFLENVPGIVKNGLDQVRHDLLKLGYSMVWCLLSVHEIGGLQRRRRWFALAYKRAGVPLLLDAEAKTQRPVFDWEAVPMPPKTTEARHDARIQVLGNSVVPDVARVAFRFLAKTVLENPRDGRVKTNAPEYGRFDTNGAYRTLSNRWIAGHLELNVRPPIHVPLDPTVWVSDKPPLTVKHHSGFVVRTITRPYFGTPRFGMVGASNYLTRRACQDLPSQVRFVRDGEHKYSRLNAKFVEWLMGFPLDWTKTLDGNASIPRARK